MHVVIGIVIGHSSLMERKVRVVTCAAMCVTVKSGTTLGVPPQGDIRLALVEN
jgi:hypothetical protein